MKKQIKRKIYLLSKKQPMKPIEVIQYETGIQLIFEVQDIELDTTATATMFVRKPSGKFVFQEDNIFLTGNTITVDLHNQALAEYGHPFFQIKFKKDEEVISTYSGMLSVDKSLEDSGAEESKTVIAAFDTFTDEQIARIEEATQTQIDLMKAEVEAKGLSVLSTIPDDYTEMFNRLNALYNSVANAIKGFVSGSVIRVDDVSPVEHNPVVKVHGKNLFDYSQMDFENRDSALVDNGNGSITINAPTGSSAVSTKATLRQLAPTLKIGKLYTLSFDSTGTDKYIYLSESQSGWNNKTARIVTESDLNSTVFLYASGVNTTATISNIQIEEGTTATEYAPYIDPTTVTVTRCGKNLISQPYAHSSGYTSNGVTFTVEEDGSVVINGAPTGTTEFLFERALTLPVGSYSYRLFGVEKAPEMLSGVVNMYNGEVWAKGLGSDRGNGVTFEVTEADTEYVFRTNVYILSSGKTFSNFRVSPVLCVGNIPNEYEKYKGSTFTPSSDGTVEGVTSLPPTMTLLTDTEGVTIECEYNKDTGKVIDNLTKAVVALGGVV